MKTDITLACVHCLFKNKILKRNCRPEHLHLNTDEMLSWAVVKPFPVSKQWWIVYAGQKWKFGLFRFGIEYQRVEMETSYFRRDLRWQNKVHT